MVSGYGIIDQWQRTILARICRTQMSFLVTRIVQDSEGSIVWRATNDAQHDEAARYRHEAMAIGINGVIGVGGRRI